MPRGQANDHETEMQFRPTLQRPPPFDQLGIAVGKLPAPVDPSSGVRARECQGVGYIGLRLEVVKGGHRPNRITKCLMSGHVGDRAAINIDVAAVVQALNVVLPCLYRNHFPSSRGFVCLAAAGAF